MTTHQNDILWGIRPKEEILREAALVPGISWDQIQRSEQTPEPATFDLEQIFFNFKPSAENLQISSLEEGLEILRAGKINGFEIAADQSFYPISLLARIRRDNEQFQLKLMRNGMEGSGFYTPELGKIHDILTRTSLIHRGREIPVDPVLKSGQGYFRAI